jgi:pyruvate/2-oxoglutarate/acetoin dehydrogenase E1 component
MLRQTQDVTTRELTYSAAFAEGVAEEMATNPDIFVIGTDLVERGGHWAQVKGLAQQMGPGRVFDTPISEAAMVATGVGAAVAGLHPIVDLNFIDFAFGAMDEIANQAAKVKFMLGRPVPLVIRATAGIAHGGPQHNNSLEAWFMHMPGLVVAVPFRPYDAKGLIKTALRAAEPVIFLMHKRLTGVRGPVGGPDDLVAFGSAHISREGDGCTIVTYGAAVDKAMQAADVLAASGVSAEVIDLRTLVPLDLATITASARKTGHVVVLDEAPKFAGPSAEIAAAVQEAAFEYLDAAVTRVGAWHSAVPEGPGQFDQLLPSVDDVVRAVERTFESFGSQPQPVG